MTTAYAAPHWTMDEVIIMHPPPPVPQTSEGRHPQVNLAVQAVGVSRQNGGGFTQAGGIQPGPGPPPDTYWQNEVKV